MLTLLKQARAYGLGCVLATQNPVDLDYKGLSNTGTWFLGRLQTERDKMRVLDGLEGASASAGGSFDRKAMEATLSGLKSRVFLMNNVHDNAPELFHTRWALSYLRGPLTQTQIKTLMAPKKQAAAEAQNAATAQTTRPATGANDATHGPSSARSQTSTAHAPIPVALSTTSQLTSEASAAPQAPPTLAEGIEQWFLPATSHLPAGAKGHYRPMLYSMIRVHWVQTRLKLDHWEELHYLVPLDTDGALDPWESAEPLAHAPQLSTQPLPGLVWSEVPDDVRKKTTFTRWTRALKSHAYRTQPKSVFECKSPKAASDFGQTEGDFRVTLKQHVNERRDLALAKLQTKYAPKLERLQERERKAKAKIDIQTSQYKEQKFKTAISVGATVLGAIFGRKVASAGNVGRAGTAMRTAGRTSKERDDIKRAEADLEAIQEQIKTLQAQFDEDSAEIKDAADVNLIEVSELLINPRKGDLQVSKLGLVWKPYQLDANGFPTPLTQ